MSENTRRGLHQKARNGYFPSSAPTGYLNDSRNKSIVIDKRVAPHIISVFEKYSKGNIQLKEISSFLASKGVKTRLNNHKSLVSIRTILSNPFYTGFFRYGGEIYEGRHDPIISKKLFDEVQEVLNIRNHPWKHARVERIHKPYLGLLRCGECGMMISGEIHDRHHVDGSSTVFKYYRCTKKSKVIKCLQPNYILEEDLHSQLTTLIKQYSLKKDWAKQMFKKLEKEELNIAQSSLDVIATKRKDLELINSKLKLLLDSYLDQVIDMQSFQEKKFELTSKKKTIEEQILSLKRHQGSWIEPMKNWIIEASSVDQIVSSDNKDDIKVLATKIFGSNITLQNKTVRGDGQKSWSLLRSTPTGRSLAASLRFERR